MPDTRRSVQRWAYRRSAERTGSHALLGLLSLLFALAIQPSSWAQEVMVIQRLASPIRFDGLSDEPAWQAIEPLPVVQYKPNFGGAPSERTEIRIAYDDQYLYASARSFDDPGKVLSTTFKRDFRPGPVDVFWLAVDAFNDDENALAFVVAPSGARLDAAIYNDAQPSFPFKHTDMFWDAETAITDEGWFAEIRIPFSTLGFQTVDDQVVMGLIACRYIARKSEDVLFPAISPDFGQWAVFKPSQAQDIVLKGIRSAKPLYVTPYLLGGRAQEYRLDDGKNAYARLDETTYDAGLDVRYGLTSNLTLDLTVNTDFAQIEADDQQVNLTRFSLFFPEKRRFFQERASIFDFGPEEPASVLSPFAFNATQLFYSRRIGLYEGSPVGILGGARLVGRVGAWEIGLMNMQTTKEPGLLVGMDPLPPENFGVVRLRRKVLNANSSAGLIATNRVDLDGRYNFTYGADGLFRLFDNEYLIVGLSQTQRNGVDVSGRLLDQSRLHARWERRTYEGFGYELNLARSGAAYDPGIGFALRRDYTRFGDRLFYGWLPGEASPLRNHQVELRGATFLRNLDGSTETTELGFGWSGTWKAGTTVQLLATRSYEDVLHAFTLAGETEILPGRYTFYGVQASYSMPSGQKFNTRIIGSGGTFYDGRRLALGLIPRWALSRYLEFEAFYEVNALSFPEREEQAWVHVGRFRLQAALNVKVSASAFVQYHSGADAVIANARLRYNPREGNDLYVVYDEGLNTDRLRLDPMLPLTSSRTLMIKFAHTFHL